MKIAPPYKHLVQKPSCCGSTCLQMVLFRRGHWLEQEELAHKINTKIRKDYSKFFEKDFLTAEVGDAGAPLEGFLEINPFLKQFNLKAQVFKISQIKDLKEFLAENLKDNKDVIINFSRLAYHPERNWGHFALISSINDNEIEICDPSYHSKAYWKTTLTQLKEAMLPEWDGKERGLAIISQI